MRSPICLLEDHIAGVAFSIAPEKADRCKESSDKHGIYFELIDDNDFSIRVRMDNATIILPISSLEYLWAFSLYCWVLTQEYANGQRAGFKQIDCVGNDRLRSAHTLLEWASKNIQGTGRDIWPEDLPAPAKEPKDCSDIHVANELFLCSLGWMVHHEIGHIVLQHPALVTNFSEQEEKEADRHATNWLLSELDDNSPVLKKRALGIAAGVLCLQSLEVKSKSCLRNTHPNAHDRIFDCLSKYTVGTEEIIEAFCTVILQYLFHAENIQADINNDSFCEVFHGFLLEISRSKNGGSL